MNTLHFWNGNKSKARQAYEWDLTRSLFNISRPLINNTTDYPSADDEGNIFATSVDLLVTVAGNPKFAQRNVIKLEQPLDQGLLGKRLLLVSKVRYSEIKPLFSTSKFTQLRSGVPATWADAELFRHNGCEVLEQGDVANMLDNLSKGHCDYISLGANEIEAILSQFSEEYPDLIIAPDIMLQYPMPLVYYVNPTKPEIAEFLQQRCTDKRISPIFDAHYGDCIERLQLDKRAVIPLINPFL
ncbi:ABC transporter substrate-binding protein [Vibrio tapetis subsp. quintayensis]|uniref:ABC transporter substrate-binding protein n=1 Tax=Vibrio tapetis TaxID=52443 RepID=UPI0025B3EC9E|nr:ABC transporter substrate-binding protein [Vibrio tapetis]MDN3678873.1 ABC transporter substrate-binding protein [Vibrio tapetis subsp. quintayensis]